VTLPAVQKLPAGQTLIIPALSLKLPASKMLQSLVALAPAAELEPLGQTCAAPAEQKLPAGQTLIVPADSFK
jgi:hypothetical protein